MAKILLVEDDKALSDEIKDWLNKQAKYSVDQAFTADDATHFLKTYTYDVIVLDWELPDSTGIEILAKHRSNGGTTPVLMLTGRTSVSDKTTGLDTGCDDYLTKPFQPEELFARLRALSRRFGHGFTNDPVYKFGDVTLDPITRRVEVRSQEVRFQASEFDLLYFLVRNPDRVYSGTQLLSNAWPNSERASDASLRVCLSRIRKKIADTDTAPMIENVPGQGYRFNSTRK